MLPYTYKTLPIMDDSKYESTAKRYCTCKRYKFLPFYLQTIRTSPMMVLRAFFSRNKLKRDRLNIALCRVA